MDCIFFNSFDWVIFFTKEVFLRMKIKNKKADVTTGQLVIIIILIISFIVIVFFLVRLGLGRESDKQICHESVVLKSTTKGFVGYLDCKTNYLCISGGGKCEGINPTTTVKVNPNNKEEIMKAIADEMADCWWMFGEGKLDYQGWWEAVKETINPWSDYHCAICANVKFDKKIQTEFDEISYQEFYEYLRDTKKDNSETYLEYLYGVFNISSVKELNKKIDFDNDRIFTREKYVIVTGMKKGKYIHPYFVQIDEIKDKTECKVFDITKA